MNKTDLQSIIELFESHLHTIDLAIYLVGLVLVALSVITWKSIKTAIANKVSEEVIKIAENERNKIKKFIKVEINRIAKEEGTALYQDLGLRSDKEETIL